MEEGSFNKVRVAFEYISPSPKQDEGIFRIQWSLCEVNVRKLKFLSTKGMNGLEFNLEM